MFNAYPIAVEYCLQTGNCMDLSTDVFLTLYVRMCVEGHER